MKPVLAAKDVMDNVLIEAFNITEALCRVDASLGRDWSAEIKAGQDALLAMGRRGIAKGDRFLFTGPELSAANTVMEIHDAQLERCTVSQMEKAIHEVVKAVLHKKARPIKC